MKVSYKYDKNKDIWCLLNYGNPKLNIGNDTAQYDGLVEYAHLQNKNIDEAVSNYIDLYIQRNKINIDQRIKELQNAWAKVEIEYHKRAENFFGVKLIKDVTAYITINTRCPYSIEESMFYVNLFGYSKVRTQMHELWHFYTFEVYGQEEIDRIGFEKYNEAKESMTVLLNTIYKDLLEDGVVDKGYDNHQQTRDEILKMYMEGQDFNHIWNVITI